MEIREILEILASIMATVYMLLFLATDDLKWGIYSIIMIQTLVIIK